MINTCVDVFETIADSKGIQVYKWFQQSCFHIGHYSINKPAIVFGLAECNSGHNWIRYVVIHSIDLEMLMGIAQCLSGWFHFLSLTPIISIRMKRHQMTLEVKREKLKSLQSG